MRETINTEKVAKTLAVVAGLVYTGCALLFVLVPSIALGLGKNLFHGIDITPIVRANVPLAETLFGLVEIVVLFYIIGWLFGTLYNRIEK